MNIITAMTKKIIFENGANKRQKIELSDWKYSGFVPTSDTTVMKHTLY